MYIYAPYTRKPYCTDNYPSCAFRSFPTDKILRRKWINIIMYNNFFNFIQKTLILDMYGQKIIEICTNLSLYHY